MRSTTCRGCRVAALCVAGYIELVGHITHLPGYWARARNARMSMHVRSRQVTWECPRKKEANLNG
jgi:hypothetical protein